MALNAFPSLIRESSLRTQIACVFGAVVMALAVLLSIGFGDALKRRIQGDTGASLQIVTDNTAAFLANGLFERIREVQLLANAHVIWREGLDSTEVKHMLARQQAMHPHSPWLGVADTKGLVRAATGNMLVGQNVEERPWFRAGLQAPYVGDVHPAKLLESLLPPTKSGEPYRFLDFAAPVRIGSTTVGVLGMHGYWEWINEMIQTLMPAQAREQQLEIFIFDKNGTLIHAPGRLQVVLQRLGQALPDPDFANAPKSAHRTGGTKVLRWLDGKSYLTAHARLPARNAESDLGWHIVARIPVGIAFAQADRTVTKALLAGLVAAAVASLLAWVVAGRLCEDLERLTQAAKDLEAGKPGADIATDHSSPEMRRLSSSLRDLIQKQLSGHEALKTEVRQRTQQLEVANLELARQARSDPLTGLFNRRGFATQMDHDFALARRRGLPLAIIKVDVDEFKCINDIHGHDVGDQVLQRLAETLASRLRKSDVIARLDIERFAVLLPDTELEGARTIAQELVDSQASQSYPVIGGLTISAGVSALRGEEDTPQNLLRRAEKALYEAKRQGRNCVVAQA